MRGPRCRPGSIDEIGIVDEDKQKAAMTMNETTGRRHAAKKKEEGVEGEGEQGSSDNRRRCDDPTNVVFLCSRPTSARLGTIAATPKQSVEHAGRPRGSRRTAMEIADESNVQNGGAQEFRVLRCLQGSRFR